MPWSPSSTEKFLSCPMRWWLDRQGAVGRPRDESAMEQGTLFHQAMAEYWMPGDTIYSTLDHVIVRARDRVIDQEGAALKEQGVIGVEVNLDGDDVEAARHGRYPGTCDLVTDNGAGLTICDYKTHRKMDARYADRELRQTDRSWQLMQYAWFTQKKFGRPVTKKRKLLVAFAPALKVWLIDYPVTQQALSEWHEQAERVWHLMDEMEIGNMKPWRNADTCEKYGWEWRCEHYETCWP